MKIKITYAEAYDLAKLLKNWEKFVDDGIDEGSIQERSVNLSWHCFGFNADIVLDLKNAKGGK